MAAESPKKPRQQIVDVAPPEQALSMATSRPIIVGNRPVLTKDPMMADEPVKRELIIDVPSAPKREAKTVAPLASPAAADQAADTPNVASDTPVTAPAVAARPDARTIDEIDSENDRLKVAAADKQQLASETRQAELERLIQNGTYAVPINALKRKRSRLLLLETSLLVLVLGLVGFDLLLDAHVVTLGGVPHSHFLKP